MRRHARERRGLNEGHIRTLVSGVVNPFGGKRLVDLTLIRPPQTVAGNTLSFYPRQMREWVDQGTARHAISWREFPDPARAPRRILVTATSRLSRDCVTAMCEPLLVACGCGGIGGIFVH